MEIKLNVKDKSVATFLEERLIGYKPDDRSGTGNMRDGSPYHLMKKEMYFKKGCGIDIGDTIIVQLSDIAMKSGKELLNIYIYQAEAYDDISIKMVLISFEVESITPDKLNIT